MTWAGTVLTRDRPIVIVADPGAEAESAMRLGRIGFDHVIGYLKGGLRSADASAARVVTTERIGAGVAAERLASTTPPLWSTDVRSQSARRSGSQAASTFRSVVWASGCRRFLPTRCSCTAPAGHAPPSRQACSSVTGERTSASWQVGLPREGAGLPVEAGP